MTPSLTTWNARPTKGKVQWMMLNQRRDSSSSFFFFKKSIQWSELRGGRGRRAAKLRLRLRIVAAPFVASFRPLLQHVTLCCTSASSSMIFFKLFPSPIFYHPCSRVISFPAAAAPLLGRRGTKKGVRMHFEAKKNPGPELDAHSNTYLTWEKRRSNAQSWIHLRGVTNLPLDWSSKTRQFAKPRVKKREHDDDDFERVAKRRERFANPIKMPVKTLRFLRLRFPDKYMGVWAGLGIFNFDGGYWPSLLRCLLRVHLFPFPSRGASSVLNLNNWLP